MAGIFGDLNNGANLALDERTEKYQENICIYRMFRIRHAKLQDVTLSVILSTKLYINVLPIVNRCIAAGRLMYAM
jgi:hypothetical protein